MTDVFGHSTTPTAAPLSAGTAPTATYDRPGDESSAAHGAVHPEKVRVEEPRRHPLTYAGLALSLLALLLSIIALSRGGDGVHKVRVGNNDCVSVAQDTGPDALYCRTAALPGG
jgi:hypothetical protein